MTAGVVVGVLVAGAVGAVLRWLVARLFARRTGLPVAVLVVNGIGSALGGLLLGLSAVGEISPGLYLVLLTGFCGGLTTFSTFSVDTVQLALDRRMRVAILNVALNLLVGVGAALLAFGLVWALLGAAAH